MKLIVCDFETEDLHAAYDKGCKVRCVGFYNRAYKKVLSPKEAEEKLWELSKTHRVIFHNAAFDLSVIKTHYSRELYEALQVHDTQLMAYALDPTQGNSLEALCNKYLGSSKVVIKDFRSVPIRKLAQRCMKDCKLTYELYKLLHEELTEDEDAWNHYLNIDLPYVKLVVDMQHNGLKVAEDSLANLAKVLKRMNSALGKKLHKEYPVFSKQHWKGYHEYASMDDKGEWFYSSYSNISGTRVWEHCKYEPWNTNSPTQTTKVLRKLYPEVDFEFRKTKDGKETVDQKELQVFADYHKLPLLNLLAAKSKYSKLLEFTSTIGDHLRNGYVYADMNQCVTRTGRLSSSNPNLQNIPAREKGTRFRKLFVAPEGYKLIVGDLDRIELVVLAHYLEEYGYSTYMADAIRAGEDLHQLNADNWNCERYHAKKVIFTLVYGSGDFKLAATLGVTLERAREIKQAIFKTTGLDEFREYVCRAARRANGVLHDIMGRRMVVPELLSSNHAVRASGERKINNYLIQGSAGSIFKYLQLEAYDALQEADLHPLHCNVVHDESIYMDAIDVAYEVAEVCTKAYSNDDILCVPIRATFNVGDSWYSAKG